MDRNPYSPPVAPVADREAVQEIPRPRIINIAVMLVAIGISISFIEQLLTGARSLSRGTGYAVVGIVWPLIKFGVSGWVCLEIARGRNWARWLLLIATALTLALLVTLIAQSPQGLRLRYDERSLIVAIELFPLLLYLAALCLVFGPGRSWFLPRQ